MAAETKVEQGPRSAEEVRAEIERTRAQIQSSVLALRQEVRRVSDWRQWVRQRPGLCLGAAFAVGFFLGSREW
jgi:ElaB/YqjD/DUF883 family membrane-anchored ribosome-binding protein